jgi:citrate lyase subunit beta / citryl-CoA lyase
LTARSWLYTPGNRPAMLANALGRGADAVIVDLEDAVPHAEKDEARHAVVDWLAGLESSSTAVYVRVNNDPDLLKADLGAIVGATAAGVLVPKVESTTVLDELRRVLPEEVEIVALIESARGWRHAATIADHDGVVQLAAGEADLVADLGVHPSPGEPELLPFRMDLVAASAAAGLRPPVGGVDVAIDDIAGLADSSAALRRMGFGGRQVIHPAQIEPVNQAFTPTQGELAWARQVIEDSQQGDGVWRDADGRMVDDAIVRRARRILESRR